VDLLSKKSNYSLGLIVLSFLLQVDKDNGYEEQEPTMIRTSVTINIGKTTTNRKTRK